jgi:hypothetical protein
MPPWHPRVLRQPLLCRGVQRFGRIALSSAGAISDMKRNAFFQRCTPSTNTNPSVNPCGLFHQFAHEIRHAIVVVAMKDAPATRLRNNEDLALQAKARREKEEMIKAKNMEKATEELIEAMYYYAMYSLAACWKDNVRIDDSELKKITSETARYDALKENIMIQVKGFGWDWCKHAWSKMDAGIRSKSSGSFEVDYQRREETSCRHPE